MSNLIEVKDEKAKLIFQIDKKSKRGTYYIFKADKQWGYLEGNISLHDFDKIPSGFYRNGFGLTLPGFLIIKEIFGRNNKKIKLTLSNSAASKIDSRGKFNNVILSHRRLSEFANIIRSIKQERNAQMKSEAQRFLGNQFKQFKDLKTADEGYVPGKLADIVSNSDVIGKLNTDDKQALEKFIPDYLTKTPGTLRSKKKLKVVFESLDAGRKIYLQKVLKEFRLKLSSASQNEGIWQKFLTDYILLLQYNYAEVLEKESVSLSGKFPDFMLVDPYGYLDIYEIKKPNTAILNLDTSRKNYYWSVELSKAIAQVENYIYQCTRNADTLMNDIRKNKGIEVTIVRPRGFIVAGLRSKLTSAKMKDDFRILCDSLKNVDVILYDDLLANLEAYSKRGEDQAKKQKEKID